MEFEQIVSALEFKLQPKVFVEYSSTLRAHMGLFGIIWGHLVSFKVIWDHIGSFGIIQDHFISFWVIQGHSKSGRII